MKVSAPFTLLCAAYLCAAVAQEVPSISTGDDGGIVIELAAGAKVKVRQDGEEQILVTMAEARKMVQDALASSSMSTAIADQTALVAQISTMVEDLANPPASPSVGGVNVRESALWQEIDKQAAIDDSHHNRIEKQDGVTADLEKTLAKMDWTECVSGLNTQAGNSVAACPKADDDAPHCEEAPKPNNGQVFGGGTAPGSVAFFSCDDGYELIGKERSICHKGEFTNTWVPEPPMCTQTVECSIVADNYLKSVYVDGVSVPFYPSRSNYNTMHKFRFGASSETLAIKASDGEAGCNTGAIAIKCESLSPAKTPDSEKWSRLVSGTSKILAYASMDPAGVPGYAGDEWTTPYFQDTKWEQAKLATISKGKTEFPAGWSCPSSVFVDCPDWCSEMGAVLTGQLADFSCGEERNSGFEVKSICQGGPGEKHWFFRIHKADL